MFFRKMKRQSPAPSPDELSELDTEIAKYESLIENAPLKLLEQRERERNTIPAPDDFEDRRRPLPWGRGGGCSHHHYSY